VEPGSAPLAEGIAAQALELRDTEGNTWKGVLTAITLPDPDEREVFIRMVKRQDQAP
jgi:hypothetical protein